jgi:hypothetical protein
MVRAAAPQRRIGSKKWRVLRDNPLALVSIGDDGADAPYLLTSVARASFATGRTKV